MANAKRQHIAIIGAGITGLTAAHELAAKGYPVTILEASNTVGGLAQGFPFEGNYLEPAYHHLFRTDRDIIAFVSELGLTDQLRWLESSIAIYYNHHLYPFMTPLDVLRFSPLKFINRIRLGLVVLYLQKTKRWEKFVRVSAASWMKTMCGDQAYSVIWEPLLKGKFHRFANEISMAWLWARLHTRGNSKAKGDVKERLGYFTHGFHTFVQRIVDVITESGVKIQLQTPIKRIESQRDGSISIHLATSDHPLVADRVIATVPSPIFAQMISGNPTVTQEYIQKLQSIQYLGAVLVVFSSKQSLSNYYWTNINDLHSPFLVCIEHTNLLPKEEYNNRHIFYLGTYVPHDHRFFSMSEPEIQQEFFTYLQTIHPQFSVQDVVESHVFRLKNAQHIVDLEYTDKIPDFQTPVPGVYLANFSQIFPEDRGTNYAVRDGKAIAHRVMQDLTSYENSF
ncbi:MAG: NAD(P)/FAD-dependent oxidoreductase [Candidatus Kerfeldbacteria bacterium]|nr:NAD(P)/FAD-dependent oxidoreductase [Candidatus Kerfeldbacteria bacterium]